MAARAPEQGEPSADPVLVTVDEVRAARERIAGVLRPTPAGVSDTLSRLAGRPIVVKPEHLQRTGSFKIRGAYNRISRLAPGTEVVAASAGNHAQGVALAATLTGHKATIFMPASAPLPKVDATTDYGATVRLGGETVDDSIMAAKRFAAEHGAVFVPPFDDPLIIAGQGTIALELLEEVPEVETVVVSVGGGGLISGIAATMASLRPDIRVIGVEPAGAACMCASLQAGHCVELDRVATMADGVALKSPAPLTLAHVRAYVHELVTVTEEEISQALLLLLERAKAVVEPAGAATLAAIIAGKVPGSGPVAAVLSGGNVDPLLLIKVIDHGLSAAGRYVVLRVILDDRPGALAGLTTDVARLGLNVLEVEHHRSGLNLDMEQVEVRLTLETRNHIHSDEVVADLKRRGYTVEPAR
ncbi:MAG TPA: threonine ammonia-lyase [Actinomycetota bacterium]|jgi:threonine dehydratase|nr:threonine ammonia-lyase [Actinomycetota bacterium]